MGRIIKCHFYYLMNKLTITVLAITLLGIMLFSILTITSLDERINYGSYGEVYYYSIYEICKIIGSIIAMMLFGYSFSYLCDSYRVILIGKEISRARYFSSKFILILLIFTLYLLVMTTLVIVIGLSKKIFMNKIMLKSFFDLYIILLFYGEISSLLMIIFDNIYVVFSIVPLSLINYQKNLYFLVFFLPIEENRNYGYSLILPWWYYITFILILTAVNLLIYERKDLPN
ncbi:MAG: hypothetical protein J5666_00990 [Bacilli bacterium]|nr:hypothetical protein [Bacilli bacterium]